LSRKTTILGTADYHVLPRITKPHAIAASYSVCDGNEFGASLVFGLLNDFKWFSSKDNILFESAYFHEAGFVLPNTIAMQRDNAQSLPLMLIGHDANVTRVEEACLENRICLILELQDKELVTRFYLDSYAVRQREEVTRLGQLALVASMSDFIQFQDPDIWLPKRYDVVYYTWKTTPGVITGELWRNGRSLCIRLTNALFPSIDFR